MIETRRAVSVLAQVDHPGAEIVDPLHRAIQWRLFFPLVGRALHLPHALFFSLAHLGCLLVLGFIVQLLRQTKYEWDEVGCATVALGSASWFLTSTGWLGYFDSWLALGLLLVAFADARWIIWLACLLAPWVDERFVVAAPFALLCRWLRRPDQFELGREAGVPAGLLAAFLVVRLGLLGDRSAPGATLIGYLGDRNYLDAPPGRIVLGVWEGLRAGWLFVAMSLFAVRNQRPRLFALGGALVVLVAVGLATAQDYSRSMTMLFPAAVLGLLLARPSAAGWWRVALRGSAATALILPAHHVMNDAVVPVFNLHYALHAIDHPPAIAMAEIYELRAIHAMERAEFARADLDLALAIKLATNPASPAKQRGILAASQGRWTDAQTHFSLMAEHDPQNPDAWLMCAQAHHALGQAAAAYSAIERALGLAPTDWRSRPDVARFLAKLGPKP